jgi:hypothetical protein
MSLIAFAIRMALQRALTGKTYAEDRVFDSVITPIDQKVEQGSLPLIIVSTDDDQASEIAQFDLMRGSRELDIVIEMALATTVTVDGEVQVQIPHTDAGMEHALNFMGRQVYRALMHPTDPWADLFRAFTSSVKKTLSRRGAGADKGVRFAARQLVLTVDPLFEPAFGVEVDAGGPWGKLLALMAADSELDDLAKVLSDEILGEALPSWQSIQASLGLSAAAIRTIGLAPIYPDGADTVTGEAPIQIEATLEAADQGDSRTIVYGTLEPFEAPPAP